MIAIGALYGADEGVKRKIVFVRGTIEEPIITRIVEIDAQNESDLFKTRSELYGAERQGLRTTNYGVFKIHVAADYGFESHQQRGGDSETENNLQLGADRGTSSSGTQEAESGVRNTIAPIAETFTDTTGKSRKVRRLGKQYMVEGTKKRKIVFARGTIEEPIIMRIVKIDTDNEAELSEEREYLYAFERRGIRTKTNGILTVYTIADVTNYSEYVGRRGENTRNDS